MKRFSRACSEVVVAVVISLEDPPLTVSFASPCKIQFRAETSAMSRAGVVSLEATH